MTPKLKPDGNRAIMFCSTTDAYQVIRHPDPKRQRELNAALEFSVRRALALIHDCSTLNVRVLTRSPLARRDIDIFKSFGNRLVIGMSIPTLNNKLARAYEPNAPAPSLRLATLQAMRKAGLHVFVAIAPTYPECDEADLRRTLQAVRELDPVTVFHEPINIRAENVDRIQVQAAKLGIVLDTSVFATPEAWQQYAMGSLELVERLATELGLIDRLKLWPDEALASMAALKRVADPAKHLAWLNYWWNRISDWPGMPKGRSMPVK